MENSLKKSTIDVDAFLPFGSLIEIGNERKKFTINNGYCERFDEIATVEIEGNEAKPIISIFSAKHPYGWPRMPPGWSVPRVIVTCLATYPTAHRSAEASSL